MPKEVTLLKYINQTMHSKKRASKKQPGPLVTVSREYGCPGLALAEALISELQSIDPDWKKVDKEVLNEAARELSMSPDEIEKIIKEKNPGVFRELFSAFSTSYVPSDITIKKKYAAMISSIANQGKVVIVGRGSEVLTNHIQNSLHIRIIARKEYRLPRVQKMHGVDEKNAREIIEKVDRERIYLRDFFSGETTNDYYYDVIFNAERNSVEAMFAAAMKLIRERGLLS